MLHVNGFGQEVISAKAHGLHGLIHAAEAGGDDDGNRQPAFLHFLDDLHAAQPGHFQIGDNNAVVVFN